MTNEIYGIRIKTVDFKRIYKDKIDKHYIKRGSINCKIEEPYYRMDLFKIDKFSNIYMYEKRDYLYIGVLLNGCDYGDDIDITNPIEKKEFIRFINNNPKLKSITPNINYKVYITHSGVTFSEIESYESNEDDSSANFNESKEMQKYISNEVLAIKNKISIIIDEINESEKTNKKLMKTHKKLSDEIKLKNDSIANYNHMIEVLEYISK